MPKNVDELFHSSRRSRLNYRFEYWWNNTVIRRESIINQTGRSFVPFAACKFPLNILSGIPRFSRERARSLLLRRITVSRVRKRRKLLVNAVHHIFTLSLPFVVLFNWANIFKLIDKPVMFSILEISTLLYIDEPSYWNIISRDRSLKFFPWNITIEMDNKKKGRSLVFHDRENFRGWWKERRREWWTHHHLFDVSSLRFPGGGRALLTRRDGCSSARISTEVFQRKNNAMQPDAVCCYHDLPPFELTRSLDRGNHVHPTVPSLSFPRISKNSPSPPPNLRVSDINVILIIPFFFESTIERFSYLSNIDNFF